LIICIKNLLAKQERRTLRVSIKICSLEPALQWPIIMSLSGLSSNAWCHPAPRNAKAAGS
jgi:hypothetical protein